MQNSMDFFWVQWIFSTGNETNSKWMTILVISLDHKWTCPQFFPPIFDEIFFWPFHFYERVQCGIISGMVFDKLFLYTIATFTFEPFFSAQNKTMKSSSVTKKVTKIFFFFQTQILQRLYRVNMSNNWTAQSHLYMYNVYKFQHGKCRSRLVHPHAFFLLCMYLRFMGLEHESSA